MHDFLLDFSWIAYILVFFSKCLSLCLAQGLSSVNAFTKLGSSQKTTFLETEGGDVEPIRGEGESEKEESSESSNGENSSSDSSVESSSCGSESESVSLPSVFFFFEVKPKS